MNSRVAKLEMPRQANLQQFQEQVGGGLSRLRAASRRLVLLYVGTWASVYDAANGLVGAGRRLIVSAEQRGERMEGSLIRQFRQLEEKTVEQLQEIQEGIDLDEARATLDNTLGQTQGELADRIQAVLDGMGIPSREQLERLNREIDLLNEKIDGIREILNRQMASLQTERDVLQATLQAVYNSTSWRITAPMRHAKRALMKVLPGIRRVSVKAVRLPSRLVLPVLTKTVRRAAGNPHLVSVANKLLQRSPALRAWLRRLVITKTPAQVATVTDTATVATDLPRPAQRVLEELKAALGRVARHTGGQ